MLQTHFKLAGPKKINSKTIQKKKLAGPIRLKHVTLFGCRVWGETRVTYRHLIVFSFHDGTSSPL